MIGSQALLQIVKSDCKYLETFLAVTSFPFFCTEAVLHQTMAVLHQTMVLQHCIRMVYEGNDVTMIFLVIFIYCVSFRTFQLPSGHLLVQRQ